MSKQVLCINWAKEKLFSYPPPMFTYLVNIQRNSLKEESSYLKGKSHNLFFRKKILRPTEKSYFKDILTEFSGWRCSSFQPLPTYKEKSWTKLITSFFSLIEFLFQFKNSFLIIFSEFFLQIKPFDIFVSWIEIPNLSPPPHTKPM